MEGARDMPRDGRRRPPDVRDSLRFNTPVRHLVTALMSTAGGLLLVSVPGAYWAARLDPATSSAALYSAAVALLTAWLVAMCCFLLLVLAWMIGGATEPRLEPPAGPAPDLADDGALGV